MSDPSSTTPGGIDTRLAALSAQVASLQAELKQKDGQIAALRHEARTYHAIFEYANDAIFVVEPGSRRILDANVRAASQLGYTREELLAFTMDEITASMDDVRRDVIIHTLDSTGGVIYEHRHERKDGTEIDVEVSGRLVMVGERPLYIAFVRDARGRSVPAA